MQKVRSGVSGQSKGYIKYFALVLGLKQNAIEVLSQRRNILINDLQKDFVDVLLAVAGEPMVFQRQDIDIADRLQIIGLQKVFDALG